MPRSARRLIAAAVLGAATAAAWRALALRRFPLRGKVALVTGGSRGLGFLIARELVDRGARVAICARDAGELEKAREALGGEVLAVPCDLTDRAQVDALVERVTAHLGGLDVLVNNAGTIQVGPLHAMTRAELDEQMASNFSAAADVTFAALPFLRGKPGGARIVNVTSIGGTVPVPHLLPYDASKYALVGFSEALRAELLEDGVRVTTIVPWLMRTGSAVHAHFHGDPVEPSLFTASATLAAIDPRRAARRIVHALMRGEGWVTLGWPARLLRLGHALLPGTTATIFGAVTRILPERAAGDRTGAEMLGEVRPRFLRKLLVREGRPLNEV